MNCRLRSSARASYGDWVRSGRRWVLTLITLALSASHRCFAAAIPEAPQPTYALSSLPPGNINSTFSSFLSLHLPTLVLLALLVVVALMFAWFVKVFNADLNPGNPPDADARMKVRKMVVFCYVFMLLTLGVAISPFIFLMVLPQAVVSSVYNYMPDSPVALVVGCVHDDKPEDSHWEIVCQARDPYLDEWLISIGGLVLMVGGSSGAPLGPPPAAVTTPPNTHAATHSQGGQEGSGAALTPAPAKDLKKGPMGPSDPLAAPTPSGPPISVGTSAPAPPPSATGSAPPPGTPDLYAPPPQWTPDVNLISGYWNFPNVVIHGGITVPLYFIIVALVGASISLTRRVPEFQKQFLDSTKPFAASEMREQLVLQILQFLSAPFLAIAGYILVTPAGPTTSIPLAFVAGFSSETVLKLITNAIQNFAESDKPA